MTSFLRNLKSNDVLVPLLESYFSRGVFPDVIPVEVHTNKIKDSAFHPSSHTGCARETYAKMAGDYKEGKPSSSLQRTFHVGHLLHGWLQEIFVDMGLCEESDVEQLHRIAADGTPLNPTVPFEQLPEIDELLAKGSWWAQGAIDLANVKVPGHGSYIVDIKTVRGMAMKDDNPFGSFREKYERQLQLYMHWTGLRKGILLAFGKDTPHAMKEIIVDYDESIVMEIYDRWDTIAAALADPNLPVPACTCADRSNCSVKGVYGNAKSPIPR